MLVLLLATIDLCWVFQSYVSQVFELVGIVGRIYAVGCAWSCERMREERIICWRFLTVGTTFVQLAEICWQSLVY